VNVIGGCTPGWGWLAAETNDLDEKRRFLEEALALEPSNAQTHIAVLSVQQQRHHRG